MRTAYFVVEFNNSKISDVKVGFDEHDRLYARITFRNHYGEYDEDWIISNPVDVQRLRTLMNYTGACEVEELKGKSIRTVDAVSALFGVRGFGHPTEDKFVSLLSTEEFTEISEAEFRVLLAGN